MTAFALAILHGIAAVLAAALLIVIGLFIIAVCVLVTLCSFFRGETNGYQKRYRLPKNRAHRRTLILTPESKDPAIVGDVPHVTRAQYPSSRANARGGKG